MNTASALRDAKHSFATVAAPCQYFGVCGGCSLQDLAYADQLAMKRRQLLQLFSGLDPALPVELVGMDDPWRYRNKAEMTFSESGGRLTLGYHVARSFWRLMDIEDCLLLPEPMNRVFRDALAAAQRLGQPAYHPKTHRGFFRYLVVRASRATGQLLACLVTTAGERAPLERFADELMAGHPEIVSVYWGVSEKISDSAAPDALTLLRGAPYLEDQIGPFRLDIHPLTFLQPSPVQAERLYARLMESIAPAPDGVAWDLYCGIGLVGFYLASKFRTVYAIDSEPHNLELGRLNAQRNRIANLQFQGGHAETLLADKRFWLAEAKPDLVVVDPPRAGLHKDVISTLLAARPKQLAYISCNTQTLVRDVQVLTTGFPTYRLRQVTAFDHFPQTPHVEVLAVLERGISYT